MLNGASGSRSLWLLVVVCSFQMACHSQRGHGPISCTTAGINPECGSTCKMDSDCGAGLYCASNKTCAADCTATGGQCGVNEACDSTGRCVSAPPDLSPAPVCPAGLTCNTTCPNGGTTMITGKVYDPAGKNGLYNVSVYVPESPLTALPKGVLTGANACSCSALFQSGAYTSTSTAEDGTFMLPNVPVGTKVPLVIQIGKWRRLFEINVTACGPNAQPDKSIAFPSTVAAGDINDSIPDIAVSTGSADSLECLMLRMGLDASEYVAGTSTAGHVHVFSGGSNAGNGVGTPEKKIMAGAPVSSTDLWSTQAQLMPYDIVLLSCEGGETADANPPALESYLNAGGRVFASHFHYSWFSARSTRRRRTRHRRIGARTSPRGPRAAACPVARSAASSTSCSMAPRRRSRRACR